MRQKLVFLVDLGKHYMKKLTYLIAETSYYEDVSTYYVDVS